MSAPVRDAQGRRVDVRVGAIGGYDGPHGALGVRGIPSLKRSQRVRSPEMNNDSANHSSVRFTIRPIAREMSAEHGDEEDGRSDALEHGARRRERHGVRRERRAHGGKRKSTESGARRQSGERARLCGPYAASGCLGACQKSKRQGIRARRDDDGGRAQTQRREGMYDLLASYSKYTKDHRDHEANF
ncbi:hypothetical protein EXIGLDRAFT_413808 [Exidia glandulosa HHB12029]|uniref:Uncharacterized protein n=1 Tax=Exidia glandulosa HHB12029 TaxID=1314781 RepID=A0A165BEB2_EXIGL|nr:hypothetical protein EXIGLDRAFT_413808 [Exidia glandulosa HHB12029]